MCLTPVWGESWVLIYMKLWEGSYNGITDLLEIIIEWFALIK